MLNKLLRLERNLAVLDLETTGISPKVDRIVQIAITVHYPHKDPLSWKSLINPEIPILNTKNHGISDLDMNTCQRCKQAEHHHPHDQCEGHRPPPRFRDVAPVLAPKLKNIDICGYNVKNFDVELLQEEMTRAQVEWKFDGCIVDPLQIYRMRRGHNLTNCYLEYGGPNGQPIEEDERTKNAHDAGVDVEMTEIALHGQLHRYPDLPRTVKELSAFCFPHPENAVDQTGKFVWVGEDAAFNFGKWRGKLLKDPQVRPYLKWLSGADFPDEVKDIAADALMGIFPEKAK